MVLTFIRVFPTIKELIFSPLVTTITSQCRTKQAYGVRLFSTRRKDSLIVTRTFPAQLVELKNGETFNGHLINCDNFMNITLREVYQTSADGDRFWKLKECYIRGSTVR
jgi:hypothetical protein